MKLKLTEALIPSLRTTKAQEDVFHAPTPGAGLRLHRDGRKVFFLLYYCGGERRRHYFGEHTSSKGGKVEFAPELGLSLKEFERQLAVLRGDLARGLDPRRKTVLLDPQTAKLIPCHTLPEELQRVFPEGCVQGTMGELIAEYLRGYAAGNLTPRGYSNYRQIARSYLTPCFKVPVPQFGEEEARALLSSVTQRAPQCARGAKNVLSCAFDWGREHVRGVKVNPCREVRVLVKKGKRERYLNDLEITTLLSALPKLKDQNAADVYMLILASLCRPGEATSIDAKDIVVLNGERVWRVADPKNGNEFIIPLYGKIGEILNRRLLATGGKGPLFWKTNGEDYPNKLKRANGELRRLTGALDVRPHDLRRTARTHVSALGVRDEVAEALLNHAKESVNGTYNLYTYWQERKEALKVWHRRLEEYQYRLAESAA
jgi:integrase